MRGGVLLTRVRMKPNENKSAEIAAAGTSFPQWGYHGPAQTRRAGRAVDAVPAVQGHDLSQGSREPRFNVCPECDYHFYLPARDRIAQLLDEDSFEEWFTDLRPVRPAGVQGPHPLRRRLKAEQAKTGMPDAAVVGKGFIRGRPRGVRRHRFRLHGRQHGLGGRREADAGRRGSDPAAAAADLRQRLRRRAPACRKAFCR